MWIQVVLVVNYHIMNNLYIATINGEMPVDIIHIIQGHRVQRKSVLQPAIRAICS